MCLKEHQVLYNHEEYDLIFQMDDGAPMGPRKVQKALRSLLDASGLPRLRFHNLRHTAATQMLINGIDVHTVSRRLGHAKTNITLDVYAHAIPGSQDKAAKLMDEITTPIAFPQELTTHKLPTTAPVSNKSVEKTE